MAEIYYTSNKDADAADMPSAPLLSTTVSTDDVSRRPFAEAETSQGPDGSCTSASCRICMDDANTMANPLISPCLCAGSTRFVHRQCLARWRATKAGTPAHYRCEICHFEYQFRRLWWARLLRHKATSVCAFLLLLLSASALLGFIPLIQALVTVPPTASSSPLLHLANGLILFGTVSFVGMLVAAAAGYPVCGQGGGAGCSDPGCSVCYIGDCHCSGGDGDSGGAVCLCMLAMAAVVGIAFAAQAMYGLMYGWIQARLHDVEVMVENVGPMARKRAMDRAARKGSESAAARVRAAGGAAAGAMGGSGMWRSAAGGAAGGATKAPCAACMV